MLAQMVKVTVASSHLKTALTLRQRSSSLERRKQARSSFSNSCLKMMIKLSPLQAGRLQMAQSVSTLNQRDLRP